MKYLFIINENSESGKNLKPEDLAWTMEDLANKEYIGDTIAYLETY
jgi:hypothetical protein